MLDNGTPSESEKLAMLGARMTRRALKTGRQIHRVLLVAGGASAVFCFFAVSAFQAPTPWLFGVLFGAFAVVISTTNLRHIASIEEDMNDLGIEADIDEVSKSDAETPRQSSHTVASNAPRRGRARKD